MKTKLVDDSFTPVRFDYIDGTLHVSPIKTDTREDMISKGWKCLRRFQERGRTVEVWERKPNE